MEGKVIIGEQHCITYKRRKMGGVLMYVAVLNDRFGSMGHTFVHRSLGECVKMAKAELQVLVA